MESSVVRSVQSELLLSSHISSLCPPHQPLLVGLFSADSDTGCLQFEDATGSVLVVAPSSPNAEGGVITAQEGNVLMVEEFEVIVEHMVHSKKAKCDHHLIYLNPLSWRAVTTTIPANGLLYPTEHRTCFYFVVLHKNSLVKSSLHTGSQWCAQVEVLCHTDLRELAALVKIVTGGQAKTLVLNLIGPSVSWYPRLLHGCLYSLVSGTSVVDASLKCISVTDHHTLEMLECFSPSWYCNPPPLELVSVVNKVPLPMFAVVGQQISSSLGMLVHTSVNVLSNHLH